MTSSGTFLKPFLYVDYEEMRNHNENTFKLKCKQNAL